MTEALHTHLDGSELWHGVINGAYVEYLTRDPDEVLHLRGVATGRATGAELVNTDGVVRARAVHCW